MARHRGFLEVRGVSRESSTTLTHDGGGGPWENVHSPPFGTGLCPLSTLSSHHSLLSSHREYESTEGLVSSGISSADSWAQDDEFDRNATRKVRAMFEELQAALFEKKPCEIAARPHNPHFSGVTKNMEREISEWTEMFPHFRILGRQVCPHSETGTEFISREEMSRQELDVLLDRSMTLSRPSPSPPAGERAEQCGTLDALVLEGSKIKHFPKPTTAPDEEEVLASEGNNEEYLALDKPDSFSSVAQVYYKYHQKPGFPPITPKSHRRHTIHSLVFENLWTDCMDTSEPLIVKICTGMLPDILSRRSMPRPLIPPSPRDNSRGLQDVMTIRRVPLQERSSSQQTIFREMSSQVGRPQSSRLPTVKSVSGLGSLLPLRQKSRDHLLPPVDRNKILSPIFNVSVSENIASAGLRGRQLRQQPRRLPPLTSEYANESSEHFSPKIAGRNGESRAVSAQPEDSRRSIRNFYAADSRPNTTSTFRVHTAVTRRPPSTNTNRKYQTVAPLGLEIFGASTGTTVSSKGSRLAVVDPENRLTVVESDHGAGVYAAASDHAPAKTPTITENVFTKPGRVWITGVQDIENSEEFLFNKLNLEKRLWKSR